MTDGPRLEWSVLVGWSSFAGLRTVPAVRHRHAAPAQCRVVSVTADVVLVAHGARLGWLLLPHERAVEIWRAGRSELAERLALDLEEIWAVGGCSSGARND